ncbi:MAG: fatty acyl-AMP ligase [Acidimicrobiia bacterium]|nr:fatty acyl-AMP ligase [Acidimicrobiia bacterium]
MEAATEHGTDIVLLDGAEPEQLSWGALHDEARRMAACLQQQGVAPGDRVALLGATSRPFVAALQACWLAGAAVIVLPLRTRLEPEAEFRDRSLERIRNGEASIAICDPDQAETVAGAPGTKPLMLPDLVAAASATQPSSYERPADDPEATAILQFTSGSTADPKGVVIPQRCLLANLDAVAERAPLDVSDDVIVSWLPLYHDMGLVYNTAQAMTTGVRYVLAPPARFIASPGSWMEWMEAFEGTWTIGPNFSLALAGRLLKKAESLDLSRCRRFGSGSEPIDPNVMEAFAAAASPHAFTPGAMYSGYGMAEATVAVSFHEPGTGFSTDTIDAERFELDGVAAPVDAGHANARRLARCGPPLSGFDLRISDPDTGAEVDERVAGEIELRGPSVVPGYFRRPDATAAAFRDGGWLRTGDLGYMADGDLVVCGRIKDVIIVGGRNVFPEDLERAAQTVEGVRPGNVIAFGVAQGRKGDGLVVVAEIKSGDAATVRDGIARAVRQSGGVRPDDVVLVAPGTLPKTSSGKLRRGECRTRYQAAELEQL